MRVMKFHQKLSVAAIGLACMTATLLAAPQPTPKKKSKKAEASKAADQQAKKSTDQQVSKQDDDSALKKQLADQQAEINQLLGMVEQLTQRLDAQTPAQRTAAPAPQQEKQDASVTAAGPATAKPEGQYPSMSKVASLAPILPASNTAKADQGSLPRLAPIIRANAASGGAGSEGDSDSPLQFKIGSAYVTPVGFMDFTTVFRTHDGGSTIGTNFAGIPYGNVFQNNLSEFRMSMQNSRVGFRIDALTHGAHVIGYMEADYLGNNPGNVEVSSNSNTMRSRLYWLDVRKGAFEVLGGQTWSLLTPGRTGISPLPGDIFFTQNIDVNYQLGLFWGRIPELRFVYHPSKKAAFAFAVDSPEQYVGGSAGGGLITFPTALSATYSNELNTGGNTFGVPNVAPDFIAKLALDPSSKLHFELGGIERNFKVWNPATSTSYSAAGGGGFANLNFQLFKGMRILTNNFFSDGGGRYIFGQAPDLVIKADGSPSLVHSDSSVTGFEYTHGNSLVWAYYGGLYVFRNTAIDTNGKYVGYGYKGSPSGQNRAVQEGTFGINQTLWKDPKWGAVNLMGQYSYLQRNPWSVAAGSPSDASLNMIFVNLRYTLPGSAPTLGK